MCAPGHCVGGSPGLCPLASARLRGDAPRAGTRDARRRARSARTLVISWVGTQVSDLCRLTI